MKRIYLCCLAAVLMAGCASAGNRTAASALMSLDEAIEAAVTEIEANMKQGTEIVVYKINASHDTIGEYLADSLNERIAIHKKLVPMAKKADLSYLETEHDFQMSGFVSDESAVGIGHYLGAKAVISGSLDRYADFSQLRLRVVDVRTSALAAAYTARIRNNDMVLANVIALAGADPVVKVSENALNAMNQGRDLYAAGKPDAAIAEFDKAIAIDKNFAEAYYWRGNAYQYKQNYNRAIADFEAALRINPNYTNAKRGIELARQQQRY